MMPQDKAEEQMLIAFMSDELSAIRIAESLRSERTLARGNAESFAGKGSFGPPTK